MNPLIIITLTAMFVSTPTWAKIHRSSEVTRMFQRENPCPSTGLPYGKCPGWIKDHIVPLDCGGPDAVSNLQWQTVADAKAKDKWESKGCKRK